jgi:hypothetical protein
LQKQLPNERTAVLDSETIIRTPHSDDDQRTSVSMKTHGCELVLFFDDPGRQGPLRELRLLPASAELEPRVVRQFAPQSPLYVQYARATMTDNDDDWRGSLQSLREIGATRRGLGAEFYKIVADNHRALAGEPHPVKALAEMHHVAISTASRWISETRRRGYLPPGNEEER